MRLAARVTLLSIACATACVAQGAAQSAAPSAPQAAPAKAKKAEGAVTGTAYCADTNMPARRAAIILVPASGKETGRMMAATTDLDGRFAINKVPEGTYYVSSLLAGYLNPLPSSQSNQLSTLSDDERKDLESRVTKVVVAADLTSTASVRMERAAEIDGTAFYDDGSPAIGLPIQLRLKSPPEEKPAEQLSFSGFIEYAGQHERVTDDRGRFRLLGLAPGEYLVSVQIPTASDSETESNMLLAMLDSSSIGSLVVYYGDSLRASKAKPIKIEGGESFSGAEITIPLQKLHTIRGHVVLQRTGQPPPSAVLRLLFADTKETARIGIAINGEFVLPYVPEDSFVLQAIAKSESIPKLDDDDGNSTLGIFVDPAQPQDDSLHLDEEGEHKLKGGAEIALVVQGNMDAVTLEVPDPPVEKTAAAAGQAVSTPQ